MKRNIQGCFAHDFIASTDSQTQPLRVGIDGPVGSGKTALIEGLWKRTHSEEHR
jgi:Ni2+-binding GTPase involved in maturation of urease and hydrogenase